ncbi:MAG: hypothetical protein ACJAS4_002961 [Bacteriovoracaceae bacterium]
MIRSFIVVIFSLFSIVASAQYYDTLPKGVRLLSTRYVQSNIESSYNKTQSETPYVFEIDASIENLQKIDNEVVQETLRLFEAYPEAYEKLSLGSHKLEGSAEVNVNVFAVGFGITSRVTAYIGMPIYDASVNLKYSRSKVSTNKEVAEILQKEYGDNWAQTLGNIVDGLFSVDENIIQSGIVNTLGYEELGNWSGAGLGDIEFGVMYNFLRTDDFGIMATIGGVAPTGYVDDPDILQDIGFGDGQWDAFLELGGGYQLSKNIYLNTWSRYTYQLESTKELRTPYNEDIFLSNKKDDYLEKLGNKFSVGINSEILLNDWFKLQPAYIVNRTGKAKYESSNSTANKILAKNSESSSQNIRLLAQISSVKLFSQDKFLLPAQINFSYQTMIEGKNTPKVDLLEIDFRLYF